MLRDESAANVEGEAGSSEGNGKSKCEPEWKRLHRRLRGHARARGAIDAAEARDLVRAVELRIWLRLGYSTILEYMERELAYGPRTALERLRVAKALLALPRLRTDLAQGDLSYSTVRELTRVATPDTEAAWIERVRGRTARYAESLVAGHAQGDHPDQPTTPELRMRSARFELSPHAFALLRQASAVLGHERGAALDDSELIEALCRAVLAGHGDAVPRPAHQIAYKICPSCERATQNGAGVEVEVGPATIELARCDAESLGSLDAATPERVASTLTARRRRQVFARDSYRCTAPDCRAASGLDIHHITPQAEGGGHQLWNCTLLCSGHHVHHHEGRLAIAGKAPNKLEFRWIVPEAAPSGGDGVLQVTPSLVGPTDLDRITPRTCPLTSDEPVSEVPPSAHVGIRQHRDSGPTTVGRQRTRQQTRDGGQAKPRRARQASANRAPL